MKEKQPEIFKLISENLTGLGGPMGTERTWNNWVKYFSDFEKAKLFAEKDYNKNKHERATNSIVWKKERDKTSSQDLGFVMYHISKIKVE